MIEILMCSSERERERERKLKKRTQTVLQDCSASNDDPCFVEIIHKTKFELTTKLLKLTKETITKSAILLLK